jgi:predicted Zn-dependent protease
MATPLETNVDGAAPLSWSDASNVTIALAQSNHAGDQPLFSGGLTGQETSLLVAATHIWESLANITFNFVPDDQANVPDIRVGLADLGGNPTMQFIGYTSYRWDVGTGRFLSDTLVAAEDPMERPVTPLADGDLSYNGTVSTMLQAFLHELGHSLGLDHNPDDASSIMYPVSTSIDPVPDAQDIAAIQSLYGAPAKPLSLDATDSQTLHALLSGTSLADLA